MFDVFSESELNSLRGFGELHVFARHTPAKLDDLVLATDRIRRTVQNVGGGDTACQLSINRDVIGIDEVTNADFARDGLRGFVDSAIRRHVRMAVNDPGRNVHSLHVNDLSFLGDFHVLANGHDAPVVDHQGSVFDDAFRAARPDRGMDERHCG